MGFDTRVTAGGLYELLRDARELVPGVTELEVADVVAGLRPGTPDNLPLIGPSGTPGLVLATGHSRGGVLLTPLTGAPSREVATGWRSPARHGRFTRDDSGIFHDTPMSSVNGAAHEVPDGTTVAQAVHTLTAATTGVAVALNESRHAERVGDDAAARRRPRGGAHGGAGGDHGDDPLIAGAEVLLPAHHGHGRRAHLEVLDGRWSRPAPS